MSTIILIRHGSTPANEQWLYCGQTDISLSEQGAAALEEKRCAGGYPDVTGYRVYTSGLRRTEETLRILFGELPHETEPLLKEISFGIYEMKSWFQMEHDADFLYWTEHSQECAPEGGESGEEMRERVLEGFRKIAERGEDALIVIHGGPIASIMDSLFPEEGKNRYDWQPTGGEGYALTMEGAKAVGYRKIPGTAE